VPFDSDNGDRLARLALRSGELCSCDGRCAKESFRPRALGGGADRSGRAAWLFSELHVPLGPIRSPCSASHRTAGCAESRCCAGRLGSSSPNGGELAEFPGAIKFSMIPHPGMLIRVGVLQQCCWTSMINQRHSLQRCGRTSRNCHRHPWRTSQAPAPNRCNQ